MGANTCEVEGLGGRARSKSFDAKTGAFLRVANGMLGRGRKGQRKKEGKIKMKHARKRGGEKKGTRGVSAEGGSMLEEEPERRKRAHMMGTRDGLSSLSVCSF